MTGLIVFLVILVGATMWLRFSIWKVNPGEVGVRTIFGKLDKHICRPGFHFVPKWFGCRLLKVSPQCKIDFAAIDVYTKATSDCESEALSTAITLYMKFPVDDRLCDIVQKGLPVSQDGLLKRFDPIISEETKTAFGEVTWREAVTQVQLVKAKIELGLMFQGLATDFDTDGGKFDITVETIDLPDALKQALSCHDQMKIGEAAVRSAAEANRANTSFLRGQLYDGQKTSFFNLIGGAPNDKVLNALGNTASRILQGATQQQRRKGNQIPNSFRVEDIV